MVSPKAFFDRSIAEDMISFFVLLILLLFYTADIATLYCYGMGSPVERQSLKWSLNSKCSVATKKSAEYRRNLV